MTHQDIYIKFMIGYDKANETSSYPSLTEYEVATFLDKAYLALIAQKVTGNNSRHIGFEQDLKITEDLGPLVTTKRIDTDINTSPIPYVSNALSCRKPNDWLYFVSGEMKRTKSTSGSTVEKTWDMQLISHEVASKFQTTAYNLPWIKHPVCYEEGDKLYVLYDSILQSTAKTGTPALSFTYIKRPNRFLINGIPNPITPVDPSDPTSSTTWHFNDTFPIDFSSGDSNQGSTDPNENPDNPSNPDNPDNSETWYFNGTFPIEFSSSENSGQGGTTDPSNPSDPTPQQETWTKQITGGADTLDASQYSGTTIQYQASIVSSLGPSEVTGYTWTLTPVSQDTTTYDMNRRITHGSMSLQTITMFFATDENYDMTIELKAQPSNISDPSRLQAATVTRNIRVYNTSASSGGGDNPGEGGNEGGDIPVGSNGIQIDPVAINSTYDGSSHNLVTAGTPYNGYEIQYLVSASSSSLSETEVQWSSTIPSKRDAGTYYVKYRPYNISTGQTGYESTYITVTIAQKEIGITWSNTSFTYDGNPHKPTAAATGVLSGDTVTIEVTGDQTNVGTYTATAASIYGNRSSNYVLPSSNTTCSFTITQQQSQPSTITLNEFDSSDPDGYYVLAFDAGAVTGYSHTQNNVINSPAENVIIKIDTSETNQITCPVQRLGGTDSMLVYNTSTGQVQKSSSLYSSLHASGDLAYEYCAIAKQVVHDHYGYTLNIDSDWSNKIESTDPATINTADLKQIKNQ